MARALNERTIFSIIANFLQTIGSPKSAEVKFIFSEAGWPIVAPRLEFQDIKTGEIEGQAIIYNEDALRFLDCLMEARGLEVWFVLDRLDEAFAGFPEIEVPASTSIAAHFFGSQRVQEYSTEALRPE